MNPNQLNNSTLERIIFRIGVVLQEDVRPNTTVYLNGKYSTNMLEGFKKNFPQYRFVSRKPDNPSIVVKVNREDLDHYLKDLAA